MYENCQYVPVSVSSIRGEQCILVIRGKNTTKCAAYAPKGHALLLRLGESQYSVHLHDTFGRSLKVVRRLFLKVLRNCQTLLRFELKIPNKAHYGSVIALCVYMQ
jgi:hypothetical protein